MLGVRVERKGVGRCTCDGAEHGEIFVIAGRASVVRWYGVSTAYATVCVYRCTAGGKE